MDDIVHLLKLLKHEDANVRKAAVSALTYLNKKDVSTHVIPLLKDKFWQIKLAALKYFETVKTTDVLPILFNLLNVTREQGRKVILNLLAKKEPQNTKNVEPTLKIRKEIARCIAIIDKEFLINPLIASLNSENPSMIIAALTALGDIGREIPEEPVIKFLDSDNAAILIIAIVTLGKIKSKMAVKKLIELSNHKDANIRKEVLIALNHIKSEEAIEIFIERLKDEDNNVRKTAVIALGNTKNSEILTEIINMVDDPDPEVRLAAIRSFVNFPDKQVIDKLTDVLKNEENDNIVNDIALIYNKLIDRVVE